MKVLCLAPSVISLALATFRPHQSIVINSVLEELSIPYKEESDLKFYPNIPPSVHPSVITGNALFDLQQNAKERNYVIPVTNVVSSSSINSCLEVARKADAPIMIQFSLG